MKGQRDKVETHGRASVGAGFVPAHKTPWKSQGELRRFWALAKPYGGEGFVYETLHSRFGKKKLHEIARHQFLELMKHLDSQEIRCRCEEHHGHASCAQYRKIKWLKKEIGWNDRQLALYIRKYAHVDAMRFMTTPKARGIIAGMSKIMKDDGGSDACL